MSSSLASPHPFCVWAAGWQTYLKYALNTTETPAGTSPALSTHGLNKELVQGFPGGAVVENLPANAGDAGSGPGLGRSHMPRSSWARGPQLLSLSVWSLCSTAGEAAMVKGPRTAMKSGPHLPQLEKALARTEDPAQPKINK